MHMSHDIIYQQWNMERRIKKELKNPDFLNSYTRKTLREVMIVLFPHVMPTEKAFTGMTKARMYRHLLGYAILKRW